MVRADAEVEEELALDDANDIFADFLVPRTARTTSPNQQWKKEVDLYRETPRPPPTSNPLLWWKFNESQFPGLGIGISCNLFFHCLIVLLLNCSHLLSQSCT